MSSFEAIIAFVGLLVSITAALIGGFRARGIRGVFAFLFVGAGVYLLWVFATFALGLTKINANPVSIPLLVVALVCLAMGLGLSGRAKT
jgi:hypothetical protein